MNEFIDKRVFNIPTSKANSHRYLKLYEKADMQSTLMSPLISEYLKFTFPIRSGAKNVFEQVNKLYSEDLYDSTSVESANAMSQYIRSTITPVYNNWAVIKPAIYTRFMPEKVDKMFDEITNTIFTYIEQSNFQSEHGVAINNLVGAGTGIIKIREGTLENPFDFTFVPLKSVSILEGASGMIEKVFYKHGEMSLESILGTWEVKEKSLLSLGEDEEDWDYEKEYQIIESCIYLGKYFNKETERLQDVYNYVVTNENFGTVFVSEVMEYNPFIVVRWEKRDDKLSWGHPIISAILPNVKTLNDAVRTELEAGQRLINPPVFVSSPLGDMEDIKLENGIGYNVPNGTTVTPIYLNGNFNLSLIKSDELKRSIKENFIDIEKVFATDRNTYKTAEEVARQHFEFTKRYSTVYGKIEKEYLTPLIVACFKIARKLGLISFESESEDPNIAMQETMDMNFMLDNLKITYVNPLKKTKDRDKLNSIVEFMQVTSQILGQGITSVLLDPMKTVESIKTLLDIDRTLVNDNATIEELVRAQQEMQAKLLEQQAQSEQGGNQVVNEPTNENQ